MDVERDGVVVVLLRSGGSDEFAGISRSETN